MKALLHSPVSRGAIRCIVLLWTLATMGRCSPRIYRPPALGAEYQFDRGLPAAKKPSSLFGKKATKSLSQQGIIHESSKRRAPTHKTVSPAKKPSGTPPPAARVSGPSPAADSLQQSENVLQDTGSTVRPADAFWQTKAPAAEKTK